MGDLVERLEARVDHVTVDPWTGDLLREAAATIKRLEGERDAAHEGFASNEGLIATLTAERDRWKWEAQNADNITAHRTQVLTERVKELEDGDALAYYEARIKELEQQIEHLAGDGFTPGRIKELEAELNGAEMGRDAVAYHADELRTRINELEAALNDIAHKAKESWPEIFARAALKGER